MSVLGIVRRFLSPAPQTHLTSKECWVEMRVRWSGHSARKYRKFFAGEFDKLSNDSRVERVIVSQERVDVHTRPIFFSTRRGKYYLGSWRIILDPEDLRFLPNGIVGGTNAVAAGFQIICVDSGRRDGKKEHLYTHLFMPGGFCFGSRSDTLIAYLRSRELYMVLLVVLEGLWWVNPDHRGGPRCQLSEGGRRNHRTP